LVLEGVSVERLRIYVEEKLPFISATNLGGREFESRRARHSAQSNEQDYRLHEALLSTLRGFPLSSVSDEAASCFV
jgi:hypothetical protein